LQCDERWPFVESKNNKQWIWLALDRDSKEIAGVYIGRRNYVGAKVKNYGSHCRQYTVNVLLIIQILELQKVDK